jgi:CheY-like chemotaxis protein
MLAALVLTAAMSSPVAEPTGVTGAVVVSVFDRTGAMVTDLRAEEVTLAESGQGRAVQRVERDLRPLALAVLVDSSEVLGKGFLRDLGDPVMDFLEALPPEVDKTLMTIGTPPEVLSLQDPAQTRISLKSRPPFGKLSLYDGIAEAADRLARKKGTRRAIVVVMTDRFSEEDRQKALTAAARAAPLMLVVQFAGEGAYASALDSIVKWSGGRYEQISSATGVGKTLKKLLPELDAPWLVVYETPSAAQERKVEVKIARKGTKARVRPAGL